MTRLKLLFPQITHDEKTIYIYIYIYPISGPCGKYKLNLPTSLTLFLNQTICAAGLASDTLHVISSFSFSFRSTRDPEACSMNSTRFGGTRYNIHLYLKITSSPENVSMTIGWLFYIYKSIKAQENKIKVCWK